jgi:hypothetical protein
MFVTRTGGLNLYDRGPSWWARGGEVVATGLFGSAPAAAPPVSGGRRVRATICTSPTCRIRKPACAVRVLIGAFPAARCSRDAGARHGGVRGRSRERRLLRAELAPPAAAHRELHADPRPRAPGDHRSGHDPLPVSTAADEGSRVRALSGAASEASSILAPSRAVARRRGVDGPLVSAFLVLIYGGYERDWRDHRRVYERELAELCSRALSGAKAELDPAGVRNPGVLMRASR